MDSITTADRAQPGAASPSGMQFDVRFDTSANRRMARLTSIFVGAVVRAGLFYAFTAMLSDLQRAHVRSLGPFILLGVALLIALGFECVNGFHDTANAVATVIYTHAMPPNIAVVWPGFFNFLGVLTSTGVVAFGIISLLPVELILQVSRSAGFAMVFALLLLPLVGFVCAAGLFLLLKLMVRKPELYQEPHGTTQGNHLKLAGIPKFTARCFMDYLDSLRFAHVFCIAPRSFFCAQRTPGSPGRWSIPCRRSCCLFSARP